MLTDFSLLYIILNLYDAKGKYDYYAIKDNMLVKLVLSL